MALYDDIKCPVCKNAFQSGEDIVTCPICGTPHHRSCYNSQGNCANAGLHGTDFSFERKDFKDENEKPKQESDESKSVFENKDSTVNDEKVKCPNCNDEIDSGTPFCGHCGERLPNSNYTQFKAPPNPYAKAKREEYENIEETIEGHSVQDAAVMVRSKTEYFIPKFIKNKKVSWNWSAFLFGPYYLFFRKMYKEGAIFLSLSMIVNLFAQAIFAKPLAAFSEYVIGNFETVFKFSQALSNTLVSGTGEVDLKIIEAIQPYTMVVMISQIIFAVIIGVLANRLYRTKVVNSLEKLKSKLEDEDSFEQISLFSEESNLSHEELRNMYLERLGGVSLTAPLFAYFILQFIVMIISMI